MSRLKELIEKAQRTCGFSYHSTDSTGNGKGYQLLDQRGFKIKKRWVISPNPKTGLDGISDDDKTRIENTTCYGPKGLYLDCIGREEFEFNEAILYGETKVRKQIGEKKVKVGWFRSKMEPVTGWVQGTTEEVLENGNQEPAYNLTYYVARVERDAAGRPGAFIRQSLAGSEKFIKSLVDELKQNPSQAYKVFEGVFPKLEDRFHRKPNGKILIAREGELTLDSLEYVHSYDLKQGELNGN